MIHFKARQILFDTYWTSAGWRDKPRVSKADLEFAMAAGVMFEPKNLSHREIVDWVLEVVPQTNQTAVSNAFLASLSTRRLEWRSALGSYAAMRRFPHHRASREEKDDIICGICGEFCKLYKADLSRLNFERLKWGGVRHLAPLHAAFNLERFLKIEECEPVAEDLAMMRQILDVVTQIKQTATPNDLARELKIVFPSNQNERRILVEILGYCGILQAPQHAGFFYSFTPYEKREDPPYAKNDWSYPVCWWRGSDGINQEALEFYFPQLTH